MKNKSFNIKFGLFLFGLIVIFSIFFINRIMINNIRKDARIQVEKIALAYSEVIHKEKGDIPNFLNIFLPTINFPLVITFNNEFYGHNNHIIFKNKNEKELDQILDKFISKRIGNFEPLPIVWDNNEMGKIHYGDPQIISQLKWLPYIEISFTLFFLFFVIWGFQIIRSSEKNYIWAGMARETAHQLGTPITSLFGWLKLLEEDSINKDEIFLSIEEDVKRLSDISDRFYKIGTSPSLFKTDITKILLNTKKYFINRIPKNSNIKININFDDNYFIKGDPILLTWAVENIIKNSLDASNYINSIIEINIFKTNNTIIIDISDNGKGILRKKWKKIFEPGFSSKKRGWGLGLSLTKRIIEDLHNGKINVIQSKPNNTLFRLKFLI